jgi:uncharacterized protein YjiS (DUF1127 family)
MTMILTDSAELSAGAIHPTIRTIAVAFVRWRANRARRIALRDLLELDAYRLDDLGLSIEAVQGALVRTR